METLLGGHGGGQHLQTYRAGQLGLEVLITVVWRLETEGSVRGSYLGRDCDLLVVSDGLLGCPVQLVQRQVPVFT